MGHLSSMRHHGKGPRGGVSKLLGKPLRKVVDNRGGLEKLECGHEQLAVHDLIGPTFAERRRCRSCPDQPKKEQPKHRLEMFREDKGRWILLVEDTPAKVSKELRSARYLGHRVRKFGANGRLLFEDPAPEKEEAMEKPKKRTKGATHVVRLTVYLDISANKKDKFGAEFDAKGITSSYVAALPHLELRSGGFGVLNAEVASREIRPADGDGSDFEEFE